MPKPGPLGGSVSDVNPPAGSQENRPLLEKIKQQYLTDVFRSHRLSPSQDGLHLLIAKNRK